MKESALKNIERICKASVIFDMAQFMLVVLAIVVLLILGGTFRLR